MKPAQVLALAVAVTAACGSDSDRGGPDGGTDPLPEPGTPILERESLATHACEVVDAPAEVAGDTLGSAIATVGGAPLVARASFGPIGNDEYGAILAVTPATFSPMGLGPEAYRTTSADTLARPALAAAGDGALLAWVAGWQSQRIMLARLTGSGDIVGSPASLAQADGTVAALAILPSGSTAQVVWIDAALHVQRVGADGTAAGDPVAVRSGPMTGLAVAAAGDGGTIAAWTEGGEDAGAYLALLDGSGAVTAGPLRVSGALPEFTFVDAPAVIASGDQLLVAWTEFFRREDIDGDPGTWDPEGHSVIRVARVAGDGRRVLALERLQSAEDEIIEIQPQLVAVDDGVVALSWSRGTYIPVCAGCVSDNKRRLVVIEPRDLVPRSDLIEMEGETGFSSAAMVASAGDLVHLLGLDYHAISNVALARTACGPSS